MASKDLLAALVAEVRRKHKCHTLILYGSHAIGGAHRNSDFDLLAIRKAGEPLRDSRRWRGRYLDIFVMPEKKLKSREWLQIRGGRVLFENAQRGGTRLLAAIERRYAKGPPTMKMWERDVELIWHEKTLDRARQTDAEGNFRRAWLLSVLLQNYFALRGLWYEGSKRALRWLDENDPKSANLFAAALKPNSRLSTIEKLVQLVNRGRPSVTTGSSMR